MKRVTQAQLKVISFIEGNLDITFKGTTSHEAQQFISKHMDASKEARREANIPEFTLVSPARHNDLVQRVTRSSHTDYYGEYDTSKHPGFGGTLDWDTDSEDEEHPGFGGTL
jgi:hypothetical protein